MTRDEARALDAADPLAALKERFVLPPGVLYLDGNSLGAMPAAAPAASARAVAEEWGTGLVRSWNDAGWIDAPSRLGDRVATLIGAAPGEVVVADTTSVNLHKLLAAAVTAGERRVILTEPGNFPTDLYVAQGVAATIPGVSVRTAPRDAVPAAIDEDVAVVMLTHVHYQSAATFDLRAVTAAAQAEGALMLWDLSHSTGAVPVDLNAAGADLAVGCGYKYLNGGPGAPAFLFVAARHQARLRSPLSGWMGHAAPFDFVDDYAPAAGIRRWLAGTPPVLGMAALAAGLATFDGVNLAALFAKGRALSTLFVAEVTARCPQVRLASPADPAQRGSHVSFAHPDAYPVMAALIDRGVIGDFRAPDLLRFGFTPLYLGFEDVWRAADVLADVLASGVWDDPRYRRRAAVT
ncbi:Kynureninase [Sphingomonas guangdongensis]|uniref:Kynureninase n=1 Tax=Sphingomonas guangdongensis TaxID=1141890 RepID=A0A285QAT2_9SPHN|nr:kynureninase [Sphingomonas guangdongensis]SOB79030.1 Kynureninase [Sphingomonas guangdongensis]